MTDPRDARIADGLTDALKYIAQLEKCDELEAQLAAAKADTQAAVEVLKKAQRVNSTILSEGGLNTERWEALIDAQQSIAAAIRSASPAIPAQEEGIS